MKPMYLSEVELYDAPGEQGEQIRQMRTMGIPIPQILHLFAFKAERNNHLAKFTQGVMRGPSPLSPGQRELIAAFTSRRNACPF